MRKLLALSAIAVLSISPITSAFVIGFEELHPGSEMLGITIPDGYMGFNWSDDFRGMTSAYLPGTGYANGATGSMLAYTHYHQPVSMWRTDGALFNFIGADLTAGRLDNETVTVEGWRLGGIVYSQQVTTSTDGPYSFTFNFLGVDKVRIVPNQAAGDHHIAIDQIEIVPEPATMLLLAAGAFVFLQLHSGKRLRVH